MRPSTLLLRPHHWVGLMICLLLLTQLVAAAPVPGVNWPKLDVWHLWVKPTLSHKAEHSQLKTKFLVLSPALVLYRAGHVASLNLNLDLNLTGCMFSRQNCWPYAGGLHVLRLVLWS